jgi:putative transposase
MGIAKSGDPTMPRRKRSSYPSTYFHIINRAAGRITLFRTSQEYRAFLKVLREGLERHPVRLVSYCVLSNHWHLVMGPVGNDELSKVMHWVTATHAMRWRKRRKTVGQGPVYQGRFRALVKESPDALMSACRYVERNALSAGLVDRAQDWPWSSLTERLLDEPRVPLVDTPFLASSGWLDYVNVPRTLAERLGRPGTRKTKSVENRPVPHDVLGDVTEEPGGVGRGGEQGQRRGRLARRDDQDHADAHVESPKRLGFVKPARIAKPREQRRHRPTVAVK